MDSLFFPPFEAKFAKQAKKKSNFRILIVLSQISLNTCAKHQQRQQKLDLIIRQTRYFRQMQRTFCELLKCLHMHTFSLLFLF